MRNIYRQGLPVSQCPSPGCARRYRGRLPIGVPPECSPTKRRLLTASFCADSTPSWRPPPLAESEKNPAILLDVLTSFNDLVSPSYTPCAAPYHSHYALYPHSHQALALPGCLPTRLYRSLCYQVPILTSLEASSTSTALLMFPTKALAQDQKATLKSLLGAAFGPEAEEWVEVR